jgi:5-methylcytosine-specific restriction endonuclease McrA
MYVALLLREEPWSEGQHPVTLRSRARYRFDPEFRAKEIARRQAQDYSYVPSDGTLTPSVLCRLFAEAKACAYCHVPMRSGDKALDHIHPRSKGGAHSLDNVLVCCKSCNSSKGDKLHAEWVEWLARRVA